MIWVYIGIIAGALLLSAFISGSETALLSVNKFRLRSMVRSGNRRAAILTKVVKNPEDMFSVILLLNNLLNILIATLMGVLVADLTGGGTAVSVALATAVTTVMVVLLSELTPKSLAAAIPERWALGSARLFWVLILMLSPVVVAMSFLPKTLLSLLGIRSTEAVTPHITPRELRALVDIGEEEGTVEGAQGEMIENVFRFGEKTVADIMTPRPDIDWVYAGSSLADFLSVYSGISHTTFPVWDESKEDAVGFLSSKDVLKSIARSGYNSRRSLKALMKPPLFVSELKPLDDLFALMRESGTRLALAVDEFGSVSGLLTLTQLLEQVVGHTSGDEPREYSKLPDGSYLVEGGMSVEEINDHLGLGLPTGDYDTAAGWFLSFTGELPEENDSLESGGLSATVAKMDGERIERLVIRRL